MQHHCSKKRSFKCSVFCLYYVVLDSKYSKLSSVLQSKLFLAEGTVRNGISRLLEKLGLKDRTQLAVFAIKNNII